MHVIATKYWLTRFNAHIATIFLVVMGLAAATSVYAQTTSGSISNGNTLFNTTGNCLGCHTGGVFTPYPWVQNASNAGGIPINANASPHFMGGTAFSAAQFADIAAYIASVASTNPTRAVTWNTATANVAAGNINGLYLLTNFSGFNAINITTAASHGTVTWNAFVASGSPPSAVPRYIYTPTTNRCGPDTFSFRAANGTLTTNIRTINLSVAGPLVSTNDNFANRIALASSGGILTTEYNCVATKEASEPNHGGNIGGSSLWWTWTAPSTGSVTISTLGSSFDTTMGVYTGSAVSALTTIASNDDFSGSTSQVTFGAIAGTAYQIAVDGYNFAGSPGAQAGAVQLNIPQVIQSISFGAAPTPTYSSGGTFTVSATATSGLAVTYSSLTPSVCTNAGSTTVTIVAAGTCTIAADQAGDANYFAAVQATQNITIAQAAQSISFAALPNKLTTDPAFTVSASGGASGNPVTFTSSTPAICTTSGVNGSTVTLTASPGTCTIAADQAANGNYLAAAQVPQSFSVTPPNSFVSVASRKVHGTVGTFDLQIDTSVALSGAVTVESRSMGAGHLIVFLFSNNVSIAGSASISAGTGSTGAPVISGKEVQVPVTGVPDNSRATVKLSGVDGTITVLAPIGFLVGDVNNSRNTSSIDVSAIKARSGQTADGTNFRFDLNATGVISAADISAAKARGPLTLP